jgi:predicted DsbA family dithiol-disulfide isomerase
LETSERGRQGKPRHDAGHNVDLTGVTDGAPQAGCRMVDLQEQLNCHGSWQFRLQTRPEWCGRQNKGEQPIIIRKAMKQPIKIDFVSDIACPWCAIGLSSLQVALSRLGDVVDAELVMHPFELNPQMGEEGEDLVEHIGKKYGSTPQQVAQAQAVLRQRGADVGFTFGTRKRIYNTFDAHRLLHWAGIKGKQVQLKEALLHAYHGEGKSTSSHDVLVEGAESVGLDGVEARSILQGGDYADEVRAEEEKYQAMGIHSVPSIILNNRYLMTGAQPVEAFEKAIQQILDEA